MCVIVHTLVSLCAIVQTCLQAGTQIRELRDRNVSLCFYQSETLSSLPSSSPLKAGTKECCYILEGRTDSFIQPFSLSHSLSFFPFDEQAVPATHLLSTSPICPPSFCPFPCPIHSLTFSFLPSSNTCCDSHD